MMGTQPQPTALDAISSTASQGIQKAKQGIITGFDSAKNWLGLGTSSTPTSYGGKRRSRRHRHGRSKRGGSVVRAYNTYVDSSTRYATPVTGYQTAKPHNWVGGKRRSHRRRTSKSCWWK